MFMRASRRAALRGSAAALALAAFAAPAVVAAQTATYRFDIPAQDLATALRAFAAASREQVTFDPQLAAGRRSHAVAGEFTADAALARLLEGTGLVARRGASGVLLISRPKDTVALVFSDPAQIADIVVTGTHIRGVNPAAPVHVVTRQDIDRSGYGNIGDVVRSLPENFGGGQNPGIIAVPSPSANVTNSTNINLRGLGPDATLSLLNGRRLAADGFGQSADISTIPLTAIQRVEIVTDGSSAIYGSDAVAGVANFILRKNLNGAEISSRVGGPTQGGGFEQTYSALVGRSAERWYAMASVEYLNRDAILMSDRDITSAAPQNANLTWAEERTSVFASAGADISDNISFDVDALWSDRHTPPHVQQTLTAGMPFSAASDLPAYSVGAGMKLRLPSDWGLRLNGGIASSLAKSHTDYGAFAFDNRYRNESQYADAVVDGPLIGLPAGDLRVAIGFGGRKESNRSDNGPGTPVILDASRDIGFVFGEAQIPILAATGTNGEGALDLSLSARLEDYSDLGSATTPKIGFRYTPLAGLTIRGTWGESFKAPSFAQIASPRTAYLGPATQYGYAGGGNVLQGAGGNPDLRPEKSKSWTFGTDFSPTQIQSLHVGATYFNIDYTDRVVSPVSPVQAALSNPVFAPFVIWNPTPDQQAAILSQAPGLSNGTGAPYDPSNVVAIVMNYSANASAQTAEGVDLFYRQTLSLRSNQYDVFANATWIDVRQQTLPTMPEMARSGTVFQVPEFRARGGVTWTMGGLAATAIVNYQSGSTDTGITPTREIASWTTVDANLAYRFGSDRGLLSGVVAALSATNLLDRDPPFARSPAVYNEGVFFDTTNATAIGRFVALTLRKAF